MKSILVSSIIAVATLTACSNTATTDATIPAPAVGGIVAVDPVKACEEKAVENQGPIKWDTAKGGYATLGNGNFAVGVFGENAEGVQFIVACTVTPQGEVVEINDTPTPGTGS